jgi:hypothetical protein
MHYSHGNGLRILYMVMHIHASFHFHILAPNLPHNPRTDFTRMFVFTLRFVPLHQVFRLCKMLLRAVMLDALRSCRGLSQQPIHDAVCEFLRLVFGESEESVKFWDGMQQKLEQHFVGFQNLTAAQIANLAEWEKAANILQNFEFHAEVERYKQKDELHRTRFGRPLSDLETTRLKLVEGTLRRAALQERQLRHAIDSAFVHVEHQCDKKQALDRLAASCGIRFNHGMHMHEAHTRVLRERDMGSKDSHTTS